MSAPGRGALVRRTALLAAGGALATALIARAAAREAPSYEDPEDLYAALRRGPAETLAFDGGAIRVVLADGARGLDRAKVLAWIKRGAMAVSTYFGRFPVARYGLLVIAQDGGRVGHGTTYGYAGAATRVHVGRDVPPAVLADDWVMTHEMIHAALPNLSRRALWLQEGEATWLEPVARAQAGQLDPAEVWSQSLKGMRQGQPAPGDGGMDGTREWGRLYWGGATFWLEAEIAIHEATQGRRSLRDAMRAINRRSGGNVEEWEPERVMSVGDVATGGDVLAKLYGKMIAGPVTVDLDALFARLGVALRGDQVVYDDRAPLAAFRRRLTQVEPRR